MSHGLDPPQDPVRKPIPDRVDRYGLIEQAETPR